VRVGGVFVATNSLFSQNGHKRGNKFVASPSHPLTLTTSMKIVPFTANCYSLQFYISRWYTNPPTPPARQLNMISRPAEST
jgi:hypothetical protein